MSTRAEQHKAHAYQTLAALTVMLEQRSTVNDAGCWIWRGACSHHSDFPVLAVWRGDKYHQVGIAKEILRLREGPLPAGRAIHTCGAARCVNPDHIAFTAARIRSATDQMREAKRRAASMRGNPWAALMP